MAIRKILTEEDPILHKKCHPVTNFDERLHALIEDMKDTLIHSNGAGIAAPQIGILRRLALVIDQEDEILELINPVIVHQEGLQDGLEGCLSLPGKWGMVERPMKVRVRAQDRNGAFFEVEGQAITARCFCHELEHLDGHLFTEHVDQIYTNEDLDDEPERPEPSEKSEKSEKSGRTGRPERRRRRTR